MKQLILILCLSLGLLSQAHADTDNTKQLLNYVLNEVLIKDSGQALNDLQRMRGSLVKLQQHPAEQDSELPAIREVFRDLVRSWKKVETAYVAGAMNEEYLDHPRFIDYYHQGNENIVELVKRALDSDQPLQTALFKNSTKSINALEYLLFKAIGNTSIDQARAVRAAMLAVDHISTWLEEIAGFYRTAQDAFIDGGETTVNQLVNRLIDSSYRLKNWRVGEAGGLVKKYQGKVSPELLEYPFSDTSLDAIIAILQTHREIFKNDRNADLYSLGKERDVESELAFIQQKIDEALQAANSVPRPVTKYLTSEQYQHLFKQLEQLHNAYYFMLVDALGLNSQIIDADGD